MKSRLIIGLLVIAVAAAGVLAYRWLQTVPLERVAFRGMVEADSAGIMSLAQVTLDEPIMTVSPVIVADRVRRHPWVESVTVSRQPTGTLVISLKERQPVALALDERGRPSYYLDAEGYRMPYRPGRTERVPIVRHLREDYHPVPPTRSAAVRGMLALLPELEEEQDALLSEIHETREGLDIFTAVSPAGQSIRVRMGRDGFEEKFQRLQAFWTQSVLHRPTTTYDWIDLRFAEQVVTRERA